MEAVPASGFSPSTRLRNFTPCGITKGGASSLVARTIACSSLLFNSKLVSILLFSLSSTSAGQLQQIASRLPSPEQFGTPSQTETALTQRGNSTSSKVQNFGKVREITEVLGSHHPRRSSNEWAIWHVLRPSGSAGVVDALFVEELRQPASPKLRWFFPSHSSDCAPPGRDWLDPFRAAGVRSALRLLVIGAPDSANAVLHEGRVREPYSVS